MKRNLIKYLLCAGMFLNILAAIAQTLSNNPSGGRAAGLGDASVGFADFWSVHNNQAGMTSIRSTAAGVHWQNRFLVRELNQNVAGFILPTQSGVFGLGLQYFGYSQYNESKVGFAYARSFGEKFSTGLQLDYFSRYIAEGYGRASAFTFELGIQSVIREGLILGVHVFNPVRAGYSRSKSDKIPTVFRLGMLYQVTNEILFTIESEKDIEYKPLLRGGLEYALVESVEARIGFSTLPARTGDDGFSVANLYSFGFGYSWDNIEVDFAASVHQTLGWSPSLSLYYLFSKNTN